MFMCGVWWYVFESKSIEMLHVSVPRAFHLTAQRIVTKYMIVIRREYLLTWAYLYIYLEKYESHVRKYLFYSVRTPRE